MNEDGPLYAIKRWLQTRPSKGRDQIRMVRPARGEVAIHQHLNRKYVLPRQHDIRVTIDNNAQLEVEGSFLAEFDLSAPSCLDRFGALIEVLYGAQLEQISN